MVWGCTYRDGSARQQVTRKRRDPAQNGAYAGAIKRDRTLPRIEPVEPAPELVQVARHLGISAEELQRKLRIERAMRRLAAKFA